MEPKPEPEWDAPKTTAAKGKATASKRKGRKAVKKKPDDMPRRPLSAYNFFFSEMRTKLLADRASGSDAAFQQFLAERENADGEKKNGFFSNMGKFVAKRWKELDQEELAPYIELAEKDLQRYRTEMDEYREGVARKTRLASEQKLREQESEASKIPALPPGNPAQGGQPWMMGAANPMMGFQNPADPSFQLLLRQQLLGMNAQNPQLNAFFLQQQLGGASGMPMGFPGQLGFGQQPQQQQQQVSQQQQQQMPLSQDMSQLQQQQHQQFPDMQQQNQDILNSLQQQQNRMQGMYPGMMQQGQFGGMTMGMAPGMGMPGHDGSGMGNSISGGGGDQMQQLPNGQQGGQMQQGQGGPGGQWV